MGVRFCLTVYRACPDELAFFLFNPDQSVGAGDPNFAEKLINCKNEISKMINNCDRLAGSLPAPEPHSQKKYWRRDWISRIKFLLLSQNALNLDGSWDFSNELWTDEAPYGRLAKVVSILNKEVPKNLRVSRPEGSST